MFPVRHVDPERIRLQEKLRQQISFLERSCVAFDQGAEEEALRIATSLRVIFHDTNTSTSLVRHLGLPHQMLSSSRGHGDYRDYLDYRLNLTSQTPVRAIPRLKRSFHKVSLNNWWKHETVFLHKGTPNARRKIVLSAANKDGGAHVDRDLEEYYEVLCAGEYAFGITGDLKYVGPAPFEQGVTHYATNAHLALLRQFAHEVIASANQFGWPSERA